MKYMHFVDDPDAETFSEDSYNDSDDSSVTSSDNEDDGSNNGGDDTNDDFHTPGSNRQASSLPSAGRTGPSPLSTDSSLVRTAGPSCNRISRPGALTRPSRSLFRQLRSQAGADTPSHISPNTRAICDATVHHETDWRASDQQDRSSFTLSHGEKERGDLDHSPGDQRRSTTYVRRALGDVDIHSEDEEFMVQNDSPERSVTRGRSFSTSSSSSCRSHRIIQSIENSGRSATPDQMDYSPLAAAGSQAPFARLDSRKRAASRPSSTERPLSRSCTSSSSSSIGIFVRPDPIQEKTPEVSETDVIPKREKIERGYTHPGCNTHRPCRHFGTMPPPSRSSRAIVYREMLDELQTLSIGQVQFILSRCTCHWAVAFAEVWDDWCDGVDADEREELSKPEVLLRFFPNRLEEAARECCPPDPAKIVSITIDDD